MVKKNVCMNDETIEQIIRLATRFLSKVALELIEADPHEWSRDKCQTCKAVSKIIDLPFGCIKNKD